MIFWEFLAGGTSPSTVLRAVVAWSLVVFVPRLALANGPGKCLFLVVLGHDFPGFSW